MEYDPQNRSAPPPRYAVESDSEDDLSAPRRIRREAPRIYAQPEAAPSTGEDVVLLLGRIGLSWAVAESESSTSGPSQRLIEAGSIFVGHEQQASLAASPRYLLVSPNSRFYSDPSLTIQLVRFIFAWLRPKSISVVDSYSPQLYVESASDNPSDWSTVRFVAQGKSIASKPGSLPLEVPNAVTGLAAAFATEATLHSIPLLLLQLPLLSAPPVSSSTHGIPDDFRSLNSSTLALRATRDLSFETVSLVRGILAEWLGQGASPATDSSGNGKSILSFVIDRSSAKEDGPTDGTLEDAETTTQSSSMYL